MGELTIEQKAKAYDEVVNKLKGFIAQGVNPLITRDDVQDFFPELKESEDEKVRKKVIDVLKLNVRGAESQMQASRGIDREFEVHACNKAIAWLEKQGKQTSDPRYIILDKLIEADNIYQMSVNDAMVQEAKTKAIDALSKLEIGNLLELEKHGEQKEYTFKSLPRLLDMIEPTSKAKAYCQKLIDALVKEGYTTDAKIVGECLKAMNGENVPMAIMDEKQGEQKSADKVEPKFKAGDKIQYKKYTYTIKEVQEDCYVLDDDKVLTFNAQDVWGLVEQKPVDLVAILKDYFANTPKEQQDKDWEELKHLNNFGWEVVELEPAWGEYDCMMIESIIQTLEIIGDKGANRMKIDFLKSLKSRVQPQPRQEWSEEDERLFQIVIDILDRQNHLGNISHTDLIACVRKLKSLRPQNTWKPSEEQIEILDMVLTNESMDDNIARILRELREQLKKL